MIHHPVRRPTLWPWLVMPLAVLALFVVLHAVRVSAPDLGAGIYPADSTGP